MRFSSGLLAASLMFVAAPVLAQSSTDSSATPTVTDLAKKVQEEKAQKDKKAQDQKDQKDQKDQNQKDQKKKGATPAVRTFTNDDLQGVSKPASDDSATMGAKSDAKDSDKSADAKSGDAAKKDAATNGDPSKTDPTKTEKYWRDRMGAAREDVRRNEAFAAALQSRINGLTADFSARDDPYQRAQIADERQKALAELDRVNKAVEDGNKAIAGIEEEARKAMVPSGWIR
jgi:hypothetical protein